MRLGRVEFPIRGSLAVILYKTTQPSGRENNADT